MICVIIITKKKTIFFRVVFLFAAMLLDLGHTPRICHDQNLNTLYIAEEGVLHLWPLSNSWRGAGNFSDPFAFGRLTSARRTVPSKEVIFKKFRVFTSKAWHSRVSVAYYHITNPCAHAVSPFFPQKLAALTTTRQIGENWLEIDRNRLKSAHCSACMFLESAQTVSLSSVICLNK